MIPGGKMAEVALSQYDSDVTLEFELYASDGTFVVESGTTAVFRGSKPDKNGISVAAELESMIDPETGKNIYLATVDVIPQMTAVAGRSLYELSLQKGGEELNTANFILDIERAPLDADTLPSESVIRELVDVIDKADEIIAAAEAVTTAIDDTLTQQGKAADAKKVGDEISDLKADLNKFKDGIISFDEIIPNTYISNANGTEVSYNGWDSTNFIDIGDIGGFISVSENGSSIYNVYYDSNKTFLSSFTILSDENLYIIPTNAKYMRVSGSRTFMSEIIIKRVSKEQIRLNDLIYKQTLADSYTGFVDLKGSDWGVGYIRTTGSNFGFIDCAGLSNNNGKRIVQKTIHYADRKIICDIKPGYRYAISFFEDDTFDSYISSTNWLTGKYSIPKGSYYNLGQIAETSDTTSISNYLQNGLYDALSVYYADGSSDSIPSQIAKINSDSKNIVCWGNSLTMGATKNYSNPWPSMLQEKLGNEYTVINHGISGEGVQTIGGRQGGITMLTSDFTIPAAVAKVQIELTNILGENPAPLVNTGTSLANPGVNPVQINDVLGELTYSNGNYYFTRSIAGKAVNVNRPVAIITNSMRTERNDMFIIWTGENGQFDNDYEKLVAYTNMIVEYSKSTKYLIISKSNHSYTGEFGSNYANAMIRKHGRKFINIVEYLSKYGIEDANLPDTPTTDDETAMQNGLIPPSLKTDSTHLVSEGYQIIANLIYDRGIELGYWT